MKIIKEYCENTNTCVIRTNCYGSSIGFINKLLKVIKEDFPHIEEEYIEIKYYGGRFFANTYGLEFNPGILNIPEDYDSINNLEYTK